MPKTINSFSGEYRFLSNFANSPVMLDGARYETVEHAYQAAKTDSVKERNEIRLAAKPAEAKKLGQKVTLIPTWEQDKLMVMLVLLRQKFCPLEMRERLLDTGEAELIEGNWWGDKFWGVCDGEGENHLGQLLMKVRHEYRKEKEVRNGLTASSLCLQTNLDVQDSGEKTT